MTTQISKNRKFVADGVLYTESPSLDIIEEILVRLPVKSLKRFKAVCKSWYFNIQSDSFVAKHRKNQTSKKKMLMLHGHRANGYVVSTGTEQENVEDEEDDSRSYFQIDQQYVLKRLDCSDYRFLSGKIIGTCNGLVCLDYGNWKNYGCKMYITLWNPTTRDFKYLPVSQPDPNPPGSHKINDHVGFGFDIANNDYKVIRILSFLKHTCRHTRLEDYIMQLKIYSLNSNSWREFDCSGLSTIIISHSGEGAIFGEEVYCWLAREANKDEVVILSFDMGKEVFQKTPLPSDFAHLAWGFTRLHNLHESIALVQYTNKSLAIWTTKQLEQEHSSWIKISNIDPLSGTLEPLGFWKDKNSNNYLFLLFQNDYGSDPNPESVIYKYKNGVKGIYMNNEGQTKNQELMPIKYKNTGVLPWLLKIDTYIETLVPVNKDHNNSSLRFS